MKVLVVGSGGREHALCWALAESPLCTALYCAPGNAGIAREATCVPVAADDVDGLVTFARSEGIGFVVVGPEAPLVLGLVDRLEAAGIAAFGPGAAAAVLEGSKGFTKALCDRAGIPTARYARFDRLDAAEAHLAEVRLPVVVKADGLAAGKGVTIADSRDAARRAVADALVGDRFGAAGRTVIVEEFLDGEEASVFALVDGRDCLLLATAQDHKRAHDGDTGPNTGGMGAYSPAPVMTPALCERVMDTILRPTVAAMTADGRPYKGVLYAGLMLVPGPDGPSPYLLEYNVRFGDPECQVLLPRLRSDLLPALMAARDGVLGSFDLRWSSDAALCVVMAAEGYPGPYRKGSVIDGVEAAERETGATVFHAGTRRGEDGALLADGGRVLGVTACGHSIADAQATVYAAVDRIRWAGGFCRRDIGWRALKADGTPAGARTD